ncbi:hypothetical protein DOM22_07785 [Bdellovibrio sp. ZAP7]|uniref:hypothetical protein n=1 Tax=Bdellovibrio sp. ZAP7 TaxID=2231053 RepID=UPI00115C3414|nr:hypothetical protein [Bdellovibrio sp. ZAP7]QDK45065.1 hypothetical protein DOM22_07785 [Bdellovibrio sp. ZAP7]
MKLIIQLLVLLVLTTPAFAITVGDSLSSFKIQNQFEEPAELSSETRWILFSSDMNAAKMLTEYLNENASKLDLRKTLIISDISKMPGLVAKMFAIPKMKKYNFKLALDRTGETTKDWPRKEGYLVIIKLSELKVESVEEVNTKEAVTSFFTEKFTK